MVCIASSRSSVPNSTTIGRICKSANSGFPSVLSRFTANSISTGQLIASLPRRSSRRRIAGSGKVRCFSIGPKVTRRMPGREIPS